MFQTFQIYLRRYQLFGVSEDYKIFNLVELKRNFARSYSIH